VLLGSGIPLFHEMNHQENLELKECRALKNGCVLVTYLVKHATQNSGQRTQESELKSHRKRRHQSGREDKPSKF